MDEQIKTMLQRVFIFLEDGIKSDGTVVAVGDNGCGQCYTDGKKGIDYILELFQS